MVYQDTSKQARRLQEELNSIVNKLEKSHAEYERKLAEARESLFTLANANEPTLGPWRFASRIENNFENQANLDTPFGDPWFDNVRYITYPNEVDAVEALLKDEVDIILPVEGLSSSAVSQLEDESEITLARNVTRSARFLAFNHANPYLADPVLHQALACMIDLQGLTDRLDGEATPLPGFVLDGFWRHGEASLPCADLAGDARLEGAVSLLKEADYSWETEPAPDVEGKGLRNPDGDVLPSFSLLAPQQDPMRVTAAEYIAERANILGLHIEVDLSSPDDLLYDVYGSRDYDMALLGWRLSAYPAYLCEWFMPLGQNPFAYSGSKMKVECEAWSQVNELGLAKIHAVNVQSVLVQDLPLVPLYSEIRTDAYRNIHYPFENFIDGLAGLYGGTSLAIPNQ